MKIIHFRITFVSRNLYKMAELYMVACLSYKTLISLYKKLKRLLYEVSVSRGITIFYYKKEKKTHQGKVGKTIKNNQKINLFFFLSINSQKYFVLLSKDIQKYPYLKRKKKNQNEIA